MEERGAGIQQNHPEEGMAEQPMRLPQQRVESHRPLEGPPRGRAAQPGSKPSARSLARPASLPSTSRKAATARRSARASGRKKS